MGFKGSRKVVSSSEYEGREIPEGVVYEHVQKVFGSELSHSTASTLKSEFMEIIQLSCLYIQSQIAAGIGNTASIKESTGSHLRSA